MAVRQLKSGKWQADVVVGVRYDGRPDRRTECHDTKAQAMKAERRLLLLKEKNRGRVSGRMSFADFLDEVYWPQKTKLRPNTRRCYERDIKLRLMPAFGAMDIDQINRLAIQRMISSCPTRKVATNARETLSSILGVAVEMEMLPGNPAGYRYQYPPAAEHPADHYGEWLTTFGQHWRALEALAKEYPGEPEERAVVLALCEGLRKGEVLGLDWADVDLSASELSVRRSYTVGKGGPSLTDPKTPRARRTIPLFAYARERMEAWGPGDGPVVHGPRGGRMNPRTASKRLKAAVARLRSMGYDMPSITLYSCRHSFATACLDAGVEVSRLSAVMGHRDVSTTQNFYIKFKAADLHAGTGAVDEAFGSARGLLCLPDAKKCE